MDTISALLSRRLRQRARYRGIPAATSGNAARRASIYSSWSGVSLRRSDGSALGNAVFHGPVPSLDPARSTHPVNRSCSRTFRIRAADPFSGLLPTNTRKSVPTVTSRMPCISASSQAPTMAVGSASGNTRTRVHVGDETPGTGFLPIAGYMTFIIGAPAGREPRLRRQQHARSWQEAGGGCRGTR